MLLATYTDDIDKPWILCACAAEMVSRQPKHEQLRMCHRHYYRFQLTLNAVKIRVAAWNKHIVFDRHPR